MTWLGFLTLVLQLANGIVGMMERRSLMKAGEAEGLRKSLEASLAQVKRAKDAKDSAIGKFDKSGGVPDDKDPNLRD